jgi:D-arabinose 1-dehydrogenase-like Zn-dependent alcohol dehydrogenase
LVPVNVTQCLFFALNTTNGENMKKGQKLVIVGCSGAGGPAAMMAKKLMPDVDVTVIRKETCFIVR